MATIRKEAQIAAAPDEVWAALSDWGALHERLAAGFVLDTRLDGDDRIVTFFNGATVRERLIGLDEEAHRLAWSIVDGPYAHHNGVAQVSADADGSSRFTWTADLLPDELAAPTAEMMDRGIEAIRATLEAR